MIKKIMVGLLLMSVLACHRVPPGHVGVKIDLLGSSQGEVKTVGVGRYAQGLNTEWHNFPTYIQNHSWDSKGTFGFPIKGGLIISVNLGIEFQLDPARIGDIFQQYRFGVEEIRDIVIKKEIQNALQEFSMSYDIDDLISEGMGSLMIEVNRSVTAHFEPMGILIQRISIVGSPVYPKQVSDAIISKIEATQRAVQRENELREAEAQAKKQIAEAEGRAESILAIARAEAEANRLKVTSYNENLLRAMWIEKWDGNLPEVVSDANMLYGKGK